MNIRINRESSIPVYMQICGQIRDMILAGKLTPGFRLPPERKLAEALKVNRSTVLNAYKELKANGLVDAHVGQGTVVTDYLLENEAGKDAVNPLTMPWGQLFSESMSRSPDTLVRDLLKLAGSKDTILFAAGVAVPGLDSLDTLQRIQKEVVDLYGHMTVQHSPTEGHYPLRESIGMLMRDRGIYVPAEEVIVLSGSQQGLDLAARIFLDPGDVVFVEEPSFFCAFQIFKTAGARVIGVPCDKDGMRTDLLAGLMERFRPKMIYTIPTFQNPSGAVMSLERRKQLLSLAYRHQTVILEDDPYGQLRYEGEQLPPLKALDRHGYVLYLSTFSKLLFPGFRIGWLAAPVSVIHQFTVVKQMADLHSSSLPQFIFDRFIREGLLAGHIERMISENVYRRDIMLDELERHAVRGMEWNRPEGGLYLWCRLPEEVIQSKLLAKAIEYGVAFVPGNAFFPGTASGNYIRLNFTFPPPELIKEGVKRLIKAVKQVISEGKGNPSGIEMNLRSIV